MDSNRKIKDFINKLSSFSNNRLKFTNDIELLLQTAHKNERMDLVLDLSFFCKFTWKALNLLKQNVPEIENINKLQNEFNTQIEKVMDLLKQILEFQEEDIQKNFRNRFLNNNSNSFQNLLELIYDLTWIKNWYIENNKLWD